MRNPIGKKVVDIKPSGIRKFFDIVQETEVHLGTSETRVSIHLRRAEPSILPIPD